MYILVVQIQVKEAVQDEFIKATMKNVKNSRKEPQVLRFDFYRDKADPTRFVLIEEYDREDGFSNHLKTAHYDEWRRTAKDMMIEPIVRGIYEDIPSE